MRALPFRPAAFAAGAVLVACVTIGGCRDVLSPRGAEPAAAQPDYAAWWKEVEACSALKGDLDLIAWFTVPADSFGGFWCEDGPGHECAGEWYSPHAIYLAGPSRYYPDGYGADEWTVKHEMLHDLVGHPGHPRVFDDCQLASRTPEGWYGIVPH